MSTLVSLFDESVRRRKDHVLVHHRGEERTYGEIDAQARRVAGWLIRSGVRPGDRVGMLLPNSSAYVASFYGILRAGAVAVALNPETTARELAHTLVHCEPAGVIALPRHHEVLAEVKDDLRGVRALLTVDQRAEHSPLEAPEASWSDVLDHEGPDERECSPDDVAQIIYTSGTTGHPKGVTLTHHNLVTNCRSIVEYLSLTEQDRVLVMLPFYYSYGNSLLLTHVAVGGRLVLVSDFVFWNRALDLMVDQGVTGFSGVPSTYAMLLHKSRFQSMEFPDLRYLTCAGGALAPAVYRRVQETVPHAEVFLMYGQTEGSARLSTLLPSEIAAKLGSIGRGIPGVTLTVRDDQGREVSPGELGEITAQGENIMRGYWNDPEATSAVISEHGLRTGDMARIDEDGYVFIEGRRSDMIKSGAFRINPQEIEEVILELDGVVEAGVVGKPDDILGETVVAFVVTADREAPDEAQVLEHCREQLPRHKQVREVYRVDELPKTSSGKVRRHVLRGWTAEGERPATRG